MSSNNYLLLKKIPGGYELSERDMDSPASVLSDSKTYSNIDEVLAAAESRMLENDILEYGVFLEGFYVSQR